MQRFSQSCFLALSLSLLFTPISFAQSKQPPIQRWEYQQINCDTSELNRLGDEGWELVSTSTNGGGYCGGYLLRRLKPADAPKYVEPAKRRELPSHTPTCTLSLAQAPTIRGLRLGMTVDDLIGLFPGTNPNEMKGKSEQAKGEPDLGYLSFRFSGSQHKDRLEGQTFNLTLFDGQVTSFRIEYPFYNQANGIGQIFNAEQFRDKLIETFNLPTKEYWRETGSNVNLPCRGFQVNGYFGSNLSISVSDPSKEPQEKTKQRRNEALAKKRVEFKP